MLFVFISIAVMGLILLAAIGMKAKDKQETDPEPILCTDNTMQGKLENLSEDESGLTRVTVRDSKGRLIYGFSALSVGQLRYLYSGKDWINVLLADPPKDSNHATDGLPDEEM